MQSDSQADGFEQNRSNHSDFGLPPEPAVLRHALKRYVFLLFFLQRFQFLFYGDVMVKAIQGNSNQLTSTGENNTSSVSSSQQPRQVAQAQGTRNKNKAIANELIKKFSECKLDNFSTESLESFFLTMDKKLHSEKISDEQSYEISHTVLEHTLAATQDEFGEEKPLPIISAYLEKSAFHQKKKLVVHLARPRMEAMVKKMYDLSESDLAQASVPQRLTRDQRDANYIAQGTYILLTSHLFNLESKIELVPACVEKACATYKKPNIAAALVGKSYKEAIIELIKTFPASTKADFETRNNHPASLLLVECTGFVFHPSMLDSNPELMNDSSPLSFNRLAETMALKYFNAQQKDCVKDFFDNAFSTKNACFEANVDAIANYDTGSTIVFQPKPKWDSKLGDENNLSGLLVWKQRELVTVYAKKHSVFLARLPEKEIASQINKIESSAGFTRFLTKNKALFIKFLVEEYKLNEPGEYREHSERIKNDITQLVTEDLAAGEALLANQTNGKVGKRHTMLIDDKSDWQKPRKMLNGQMEKARLQVRLAESDPTTTENKQAKRPLDQVLTADETNLLKEPTFDLNVSLRNKDRSYETLSKEAKMNYALSKMLENGYKKDQNVLYRGVNKDIYPQEGGKFTEPAFTSTSKNADVPWRYIDASSEVIMNYLLDSKSGVDISDLKTAQAEVLFPSKTTFNINLRALDVHQQIQRVVQTEDGLPLESGVGKVDIDIAPVSAAVVEQLEYLVKSMNTSAEDISNVVDQERLFRMNLGLALHFEPPEIILSRMSPYFKDSNKIHDVQTDFLGKENKARKAWSDELPLTVRRDRAAVDSQEAINRKLSMKHFNFKRRELTNIKNQNIPYQKLGDLNQAFDTSLCFIKLQVLERQLSYLPEVQQQSLLNMLEESTSEHPEAQEAKAIAQFLKSHNRGVASKLLPLEFQRLLDFPESFKTWLGTPAAQTDSAQTADKQLLALRTHISSLLPHQQDERDQWASWSVYTLMRVNNDDSVPSSVKKDIRQILDQLITLKPDGYPEGTRSYQLNRLIKLPPEILKAFIPTVEQQLDYLNNIGQLASELPSYYGKLCCELLETLANSPEQKSINKSICQVLDSIKLNLVYSTTAAPEQILEVMVAVAQNMSKFRAAKLLSSPQTIASGGLARSQDPQTKAYKLIKNYLLGRTDNSGQLKMEFLKNLWAGDAIGQFSDASRSLSGAHWKKIITSVLTNGWLYGFGFAQFELFTGLVSDSIAHTAQEINRLAQPIQDTQQAIQAAEQDIQVAEQGVQAAEQGVQPARQDLENSQQALQDAEAELAAAQNEVAELEKSVQEIDQRIDELSAQTDGVLSELFERVDDLEASYRADESKKAAFEELEQAVYPSFVGSEFFEDPDIWNENTRASLSPEAQLIYDDFYKLTEEGRDYFEKSREISKVKGELLEQKYALYDEISEKQSALYSAEEDIAELTTQVQEKNTVLHAKTEQLQAQTTQLQAKTDELQEKTKELQTYTGWQAGMDSEQDSNLQKLQRRQILIPLMSEGVIQTFSSIAKEAKTWGPIGSKQVLKTAYSLTQKNPLASVRDASVLLTPLAIEHFVTQSMKENSTDNYLDDAAGAWKQVLSKLEGDSIGLRTEQKVGLVVSFVKQFAVLGKFGLEKEKSREIIHSVLDSLESTQALKSLLPNIRKQSRSASETVMQHLLDKHDEAVQTNQTNKQLPTQEIQRFSKILGIKTPLQPVHAFDHTRIAALKVGQTIRPAWANTATLAAAITRRPVNDAINKVKADRELQVQKIQNKLETSKALYERVNGMKTKNRST